MIKKLSIHTTSSFEVALRCVRGLFLFSGVEASAMEPSRAAAVVPTITNEEDVAQSGPNTNEVDHQLIQSKSTHGRRRKHRPHIHSLSCEEEADEEHGRHKERDSSANREDLRLKEDKTMHRHRKKHRNEEDEQHGRPNANRNDLRLNKDKKHHRRGKKHRNENNSNAAVDAEDNQQQLYHEVDGVMQLLYCNPATGEYYYMQQMDDGNAEEYLPTSSNIQIGLTSTPLDEEGSEGQSQFGATHDVEIDAASGEPCDAQSALAMKILDSRWIEEPHMVNCPPSSEFMSKSNSYMDD